jgi:hypothetical protein
MATLTIMDAVGSSCVARGLQPSPWNAYAPLQTDRGLVAGAVCPYPRRQPRACCSQTSPPARPKAGGAGMGLRPVLTADRWLYHPAAHRHGPLARSGSGRRVHAHVYRHHRPADEAPLLSGARLSWSGALLGLERGVSDTTRRLAPPCTARTWRTRPSSSHSLVITLAVACVPQGRRAAAQQGP